MDVVIVNNEVLIRLGCFLSLFVILAITEVLFPRRKRLISRWLRWGNNLFLSFFNSMLMKLIFPIAGSGLALLAAEKHWGLLNSLELPSWLSITFYVLLFDFVIYWQHRLFHFFNPLWRLHRMHHTDLDFDLTTGNRFHPLSIVISLFFKLTLVVVLGPVVVAVLISEIVLNLTSMFNHSNIHIPARIDRILRLFLVTPDMHRIHHSQDPLEHNRNFGFNFPWWDRLFATYKDQPAMSQESIRIGISGFDERSSVRFHKLLLQPFIDRDG